MLINKNLKIGIVVEYNPFHNGHIYQLNWIKNNYPNSKIIIVMSHKYSQRGEIICMPFWKRKLWAKKYGVSKVLKLSTRKTIQAAHIFAKNAIQKLNKEKIDILVFGSESTNDSLMLKIATFIKENKELYNQTLKKNLKGGNSFPKANFLTLKELTNEDFSLPNDILGFEYIKQIVENNYKIQPIAIKRSVGFHSEEPSDEFASASLIRKMLKYGRDVSKYTPVDLKQIPTKLLIENTFLKFKKYILKTPASKLKKYLLVDEGIENLFKKNILLFDNYHDFIDACVSRRYTRSKIMRTYLCILLKIKK
ncbi:nucleotidyltransferase [Mycoplasmopsis synoviae]|uniref:nucleotidyltransferase n=1 Tax=Mycoplasmopsis synoviae TaxID=2109 RepID=UPI0034DB474D